MQSQPLAQYSAWQTLASFSLPNQPGSNHLAGEQVMVVVRPLKLSSAYLERLRKAVAQATLGAFERANRYQPELSVTLRVLVSAKAGALPVANLDSETIGPAITPESSDVISGPESLQGWSFFLIERMADDESKPLIELFLYPEGQLEKPDEG